jgi:hypothetical protein
MIDFLDNKAYIEASDRLKKSINVMKKNIQSGRLKIQHIFFKVLSTVLLLSYTVGASVPDVHLNPLDASRPASGAIEMQNVSSGENIDSILPPSDPPNNTTASCFNI